jgi:hypothetical protein
MSGWMRFALGATAVALGTWLGGWPAVIVWGGIAGFAWPAGRPARAAALQGAVGWGLLLVIMALAGDPVALLATRLAGAMQVPAWALVAVTVLYPALLAGCAAWPTAMLGRRMRAPAAGSPGAESRS